MNGKDTVDPQDVGMDLERLEEASALLDRIHETGKFPALQVCIRRHGKIVLHRSLGHYRPIGQDNNEWVATEDDTRFLLFSVSKCVAATAIHILLDRGTIRVDDPVYWYIPEFGKHGKKHITVRHLLTHSSGLPWIFWNVDEDIIKDRDYIIEKLCDQELRHFPGRWIGYHTLSGGYILAEILERVTGTEITEFLDKHLVEPLSMETFNFGVSSKWYDKTAKIEELHELPPKPIVDFASRIVDVDLKTALKIINQPAVYESVVPSANIVATAEETSRFFQMLLEGGQYEGKRVLSDKQVSRATGEQILTQFDSTLAFTPQRYSLGFMLGRKSTQFNIFGADTEETFGHLGFTRQLGWANPKTDISAAFLTSGIPITIGKDVYLMRQFQNRLREACQIRSERKP